MILFVLIIISSILLLLHILLNYNEKARLIRKIPGPKDVFIIGNALEFMVTPVQMFSLIRKYSNENDRMFRYYAMNLATVNIYTPGDIERIISTTKHNDKSRLYKFLKPWLQDGLLLSKGSKWHHRRKIITPAFHFKILRRFCVTIEENSYRLVETLNAFSGEKVDIVPVLSEYTLNSICETAMGTRPSEIADAGKSYKSAIYELGKLLVKRVTRVYLQPDIIFNNSQSGKMQRKCLEAVKNLTSKVIKERKCYIEKHGQFDEADSMDDIEIMSKNKKKRPAMLDLLISAQKDNLIDDEGIQEEVDTFMFEGHDTTAAGLTYCIMMLANHRNIQEKIFEELDQVFEGSDRNATIEDLSSLRYLECCIKESLRLYPPVPFISRRLTEPVKIGDYLVPEGTYCHIHIYDLHRRKDLFDNPLEYNPDRFLPENCIGRHPYAFIPFSAGPRNCIGQKFAILEMKSALSAILRRFELFPVTRPSDLKIAVDLVLRNTEPVYVSFIRRE